MTNDEILNIDCQNLVWIQKGKSILGQVSFTQKEGQSVGVVGHNGAGKSTLFHLILGLKLQTAGLLQVRGLDAQNPLARAQLGFVPERPYLNLEDTFRGTLTYLGRLSGMDRPAIQTRIDELAQEFDLYHALDVSLKAFSKGMLQKTLIAQGLLHQPKLLILDEPMSGLDPEARQDLKKRLQGIKERGQSILFSSHAMEDVRELADDVLVLKAGKVTYWGPVSGWKGSLSE